MAEELKAIAETLGTGGPWGLLALALFAVGFMYRDARQREAAHLQTALIVAPLAQKLADCVSALERVTQQVLSRGSGSP